MSSYKQSSFLRRSFCHELLHLYLNFVCSRSMRPNYNWTFLKVKLFSKDITYIAWHICKYFTVPMNWKKGQYNLCRHWRSDEQHNILLTSYLYYLFHQQSELSNTEVRSPDVRIRLVHCASWVKREAKLRIYFKHFSKQTFFKTNIFQNKHFSKQTFFKTNIFYHAY